MVKASQEEGALCLLLPDEAATVMLGRQLAGHLAPGDVVLLSGPLGAGKTVLARGLARGLGVAEAYAITSPTFTLLNVYPGRLSFYHADLYRLDESQAAELELVEQAAAGVLAVEWADRAKGLWPSDALNVALQLAPANQRQARLKGPQRILGSLAQANADSQ